MAEIGSRLGGRKGDEGGAQNHQVLEPRLGAACDRAAGVARAAPPDDALARAPHGHWRHARHGGQCACARLSTACPALTPSRAPQNDTIRTFLSEPLDGLQRWQMFMILITLIISELLVNIWMCVRLQCVLLFERLLTHRLRRRFYAKAVNCCAELVAILDSGPDGGNCPSATNCRGFTGNCADITDQFADVPVLPDFPDGLADYTCTAPP